MRTALRKTTPAEEQEHRAFGIPWMELFLPHYMKVGVNRLHRDLASDFGELHQKRGSWRVYESARGSDKTTWTSKGYPLWLVCEGLEKYILLLSHTSREAENFLRAIKSELIDNVLLREAYPAATGKGEIWRQDEILTRNGIYIVARSAGSNVRGTANKVDRPSLVIGDDLNEREDAWSPTLRTRKWEWWTRDVMSVGNPRTNFLVVGTPIHREAISHRLRFEAGWEGRSYRSIIKWPHRTELWAQWETILMNLADPQAQNNAKKFYLDHKTEMDDGSEVLWPEWESLYDLMKLRSSIGYSAFDSEKQDTPGTAGSTEWPADWFDDPEIWFNDWPTDIVRKVQSCDPSKGANSKTSDWQAHAMLGLGRDGMLYVDCDMRREHITAMCSRILDHAFMFGSELVVAEGNSTMGLLSPELERQMAERNKAGKVLLFRYEELTSTDPKAARIRMVGNYLARKRIKVRNTPGGRELVNQWRSWPNADHDDGPDTVGVAIRRMEMLVRNSR